MNSQNTYLAFGSNGSPSVKVDRSAKFTEIKMPEEMDSNETTTYGSGDRTFEPGLRSRTFSGSGIYDATIDTHLSDLLLNGVTVDFDYCPVANTSGNVKRSGKMFITKYETGAPVGDTVPFSFEAQCSGLVSRTIIP